MTTTIVETVSGTTPTVTFNDVWDRDLLIVAFKLWSAAGSAGVEAPDPWVDSFYTGIEAVFWVMPQVAADLPYTFDVFGHSAMQYLGLHLRSDVLIGPNAFPTRSGGWGETFVTVGAADALIGLTIVRDGPIEMTTPNFTMIDRSSHIAYWQHVPLQVPAGTSISPMSYFNTPVVAWAWRVWAGGAPPPVETAGAGWGVWIID